MSNALSHIFFLKCLFKSSTHFLFIEFKRKRKRDREVVWEEGEGYVCVKYTLIQASTFDFVGLGEPQSDLSIFSGFSQGTLLTSLTLLGHLLRNSTILRALRVLMSLVLTMICYHSPFTGDIEVPRG